MARTLRLILGLSYAKMTAQGGLRLRMSYRVLSGTLGERCNTVMRHRHD
jgi:hypothetical protein